MNPLISVIVPSYKQGQFLDECLQSVYNQTYQNWECIIVNDGSPDNTGEVAKKWLGKDDRFKYVYKENGGLSSARNTGIKEAKGEWIQFLDSDDKLDADTLNLLTEILKNNNVDIIGFSYHVKENDQITKGIPLTIFDGAVSGKYYIENSFFFLTMACVYLYSKKIILDNNVYFKEGMIHEDDYFNLSLFKYVKSIVNIDVPLYYYTKNSNSLTQSKEINHIEKRILSYFELINLIHKVGYLDHSFINKKGNAYFRNIIYLLKIIAKHKPENLMSLVKKSTIIKKQFNLNYPVSGPRDVIDMFFFKFFPKIYSNMMITK